jgi:hypothetical protein
MYLQLFKPKVNEVKARVLKNNEAVLGVMAENIKGARSCPFLVGNKCLGAFCEMMMEFKSIDEKTKKEVPYHRCAFVQTPLLLIELCRNIRELNKEE